MRGMLLFGLVVSSIFGWGQITIDQIGGFDADCRTSSSQSGYGVVYCMASSTNGPVTYSWTKVPSSTIISTLTTVGNLSGGTYEVVIDDGITSVTGTVVLDSLIPVAIFNMTGNISEFSPNLYTGNAPVTVECVNVSPSNYNTTYNPYYDTSFTWKLGTYQPWNEYHFYTEAMDTTLTFSFDGPQGIALAVHNSNGCVDTLWKIIYVSGPLETEAYRIEKINVFVNGDNLFIHTPEFIEPYDFQLFDLNGRLVLQRKITEDIIVIPENYLDGIYVYTCFLSSGEQLKTGKIKF